ncbi:MAG: hypothetical protein ACF8Q5_04820 [Phycisphaerales bacterium JB040]
MHILTKVFVLIAAILSVVMAALAVSYGANANTIKSQYASAVAAKQAAEGELAIAQDAQTRIRTQMEKDIAQLQQENANLQATIRENEAQISALTIDLRQAKAARDSIEGKIAQLGVTTQTQAELIREYKSEVSRLRNDELGWRNEKLDLEAALSDSQSQLGVYVQANRSLEEQLADAQRELIAMEGGPTTPDTFNAPPTLIAGPSIRGTVQEVRTEPATGDTIIRISLGSNDRVTDNSKLYLNRDGRTYLGDVVIFETDLNHAVGRVRNLQGGQQIRVGDQVWSSLDNG